MFDPKIVKSIRSQLFEKHVKKVELDLTERIQIVTFWRLETLKNLIIEPLKVWISSLFGSMLKKASA